MLKCGMLKNMVVMLLYIFSTKVQWLYSTTVFIVIISLLTPMGFSSKYQYLFFQQNTVETH